MSIVKVRNYYAADSNMFLILGTEKTALIDAGTGFVSRKVNEDISDILNGRKLDYILLTHNHFDHIGGVESILSKFGGNVCAGTYDSDPIKKGDSNRVLASAFGGKISKINVTDLRENDTIELGGYTLKVIETPGHTPGCVCYYEINNKLLFSGDTLFVEGIGRTDFPGGSIIELRESLNKLKNVDFEGLYPGHGPHVENNGKYYLDIGIRIARG